MNILEQKLLKAKTLYEGGYTTPCWLFNNKGNTFSSRQAMWINGKYIRVHVVSAKLYLKDYTNTLNVLYKCDIPGCWNPEHLFMGNQSDNLKDAALKNRHFQTRKTFCRRGHPLSGDNLKINNKGSRVCKKCQTLNNKTKFIYH